MVGRPSANSAVSDTSAISAFSFSGFFLAISATYFATDPAADFLFAFDQELEVDRQRAVHRAQRLDGFDVHVHLAFVVSRSARVEIAVALDGLERRRSPEIERIGRLNIEVAVAQDGRLAGCVEPIGVNQRMQIGIDDLDVFEAGGAACLGDEFGSAAHVAGVFGQRADAGNSEKIFEFGKKTVFILIDEGVGGLRHSSL